MELLDRQFFIKNSPHLAQDLLGKILVRKLKDQTLSGRIVETEAYLPFTDPAAHSYIGKTPRNSVLFGPPGFTYVHSIHRYHCIDIAADEPGVPGSVLIRALEPIEGITSMKVNRNTDLLLNLTSGPGKICQALNINREQNAIDVTDKDSEIIVVDDGTQIQANQIVQTTRIGISKAKDLPLRFYIKGNKHVSRS